MSNTGMMQRCWEHDYCSPCFYMITIVTEPRRNYLGVIKVEADGEIGIELSPIGKIVRDVWRRTSVVYPYAEACEYVVMPDHFHGILRIKEHLKRPMGHIVKAFKRVSTQECRSKGLLLKPNPAPPIKGSVKTAAPVVGLWQAGFQDSILLRRGQLKAMVNYIADNPRRLAARQTNPALFTVVSGCEIAPGKSCAAIGNMSLIRYPLKEQVKISRRISPSELNRMQEKFLHAAKHGAVLVSPCISPGEKTISKAALAEGRPLIVLLVNGFPPLYKPAGRYFDACAAGRLLMLAPFPYERRRKHVTREQCLELNMLAKTISEMSQ